MGDPDENEIADPPADHSASGDKDTPTRESTGSDHHVERRRQTANQSSGRVTTESDAEGTDPLDRVRELIPDEIRQPRGGPDRNSTQHAAVGRWTFYVGLAAGVILTLMIGGVVFGPGDHVMDTVFAQPPNEYVHANDTLYLDDTDAAYLNRVFNETTHEVAYCGVITADEERSRIEIWMANTVNAGPDQIEFITDNCPPEYHEVHLHTHPNGDLRPSDHDVQLLEEGPESFLCIQGGPITTKPGAASENLVCYRHGESTDDGIEVGRIRVVLV